MTDQQPFEHWRQAIQPRQINAQPIMPAGENDLPPVFQFSQNSLQDYVDCARRFQLRYVIGQRWPAAESEPIEEREHFMEQGTQFHLLVQRHLTSIPQGSLTPDDPLLQRWWEAYLNHSPVDMPSTVKKIETMLSTTINRQRILARFDVLALDPGTRAVIIDWKTSRKRPSRAKLAQRLQTRVYPFVLTDAYEFDPKQVSLLYWFAEDPQHPEQFDYSAAQHQENREYLSDLIDDVLSHQEKEWPLTDDDRHCMYCVYRSFCGRDVMAGPFDQSEEDGDEGGFDFDLDSIDEIVF